MEDFELSKYIYIEYSLAVLILTDLIKTLLKGVQLKFVQFITVDSPKWLTLFVAVFLSVLDWLVIGNVNKFHLFQYIISFGVAVMGYDYIWKLAKDQWTRFKTKDE